jgi:aspartyl-tRNA(Asn)/glutamyl-tRNA(Gln) amidotransferase subunit A
MARGRVSSPGTSPGVVELLDGFGTGRVSPVAVVDGLLDGLASEGAVLNAVLTMADGEARAAAREAERRWQDGSPRRLEGVPYVAKDVISTAGTRTTFGGVIWDDHVPDRDAWVIDRLRAEGAILLAKTNTNELACGDVSNPHYGPVKNPWDHSRMAGGSSSGSASAVAAGLAPFSLGTDSAGSIRIPAAYCGLAGLKPTNGLFPLDGISTVSSRMDCVGPIARTVGDLAEVMGAIAGVGPPERPVDLDGIRLATLEPWSLEWAEPGVAAVYRSALDVLSSRGAEIENVELRSGDEAWAGAWVVLHGDMPKLWDTVPDRGGFATNLERMDPRLTVRLLTSLMLGATDYALADIAYRQTTTELGAILDGRVAIVTPTAPTVALPLRAASVSIEGRTRSRFRSNSQLSILANVAGLPALTVPCGFDAQGLPIGLQFIGHAGGDSALLALGMAFEAATDLHVPGAASA